MRPSSASVGAATNNIPAFLSKLWKMVNDTDTDHLICWSPGGHSFIIQNEAVFWYTLLPIYYKHNNMSSFIRQLNMYGFHKVSSENGGMDCDKNEIKFYHPYFQQDRPTLLKRIKRKIASSKTATTSGEEENKVNNVDQISKVLVDVKQLRGRQENVDNQLAAMKQENAALWRELALLRQKHMKQQQIVNKLIHFLITIVQPSRGGLGGLGVKRRFPLMINDSKYTKVAKSESTSDGPTIHELDQEVLNEAALNDSAKNSDSHVKIDSPPSVNSLIEPESVLLDIPIEDTETEDPLLLVNPELEDEELINPENENVAYLLDNPNIEVDTNNPEFPLKGADLTDVISEKDILQVAEQMYYNRSSGSKASTASKAPDASNEESVFEKRKSQAMNSNVKDAMISNITESQEPKDTNKKIDKSMAVATRAIPDFNTFKLNSAEELDNHLDATQGEIESIKDILFEGYSLDANALLGNQISNPFDAVLQLFNPEEEIQLDLPSLTTTNQADNSQNKNDNSDPMMSGSELTAYVQPSFGLDFENLFEDSSDTTAGTTETTSFEVNDDQINTPIILKKEPTYPLPKRTNPK